jgi:RNA polymerase sigma-54 factor
MRMGYGLSIEQTQKLIMTPELRQAITVLQLSSLELTTYIQKQLQENPLLELGEEEGDRVEQAEAELEEPEVEEEPRREYDLDWEDYFQDSSDLGVLRGEKQGEDREYSYENFLSQAPTLAGHLMMQLSLTSLKGRERLAGEYLIGNMDQYGYLQCSVEEAALQLGQSQALIERVLGVIQNFDPPGVGARTLQECLLIQVAHLGINDPLVNQIIKGYLVDLAKGKLNRMSHSLNVPVQEVQRAADLIRTLDPKPGRCFSSPQDIRYITPDIVLEKVEGEYLIIVNDNSMPRLIINSTYRSVLSQDKGDDPKTRRFVESKLNAAAWLIRSIEQRRLTLYKVAQCLVNLQRDFLDYGIKYLKPLNLKTVADIVRLHESTVSRATSNKYIQTPQGVLEMKFFFSTGLNNTAGTMTSVESIKKMLQEMVDAENTKAPLNDQKISDLFREKGIRISRRTVAKYRDELGIQPIRKRKRY